jgi:hypothetical protein
MPAPAPKIARVDGSGTSVPPLELLEELELTGLEPPPLAGGNLNANAGVAAIPSASAAAPAIFTIFMFLDPSIVL